MDIEYVKKNAAVSGRCRENFHWYFLNGDLYIEGTGALDYVEDWSYWYDPPAGECWKRNKPVILPWKDLLCQIRHVAIAPGCTELGLGCFENHIHLETVSIPDTVRKVGLFAFSNCRKLQEVVLPGDVELIDDYAFHGCVTMKSVTIPERTKRIGVSAFNCCVGLENIAVPTGLVEIGENAFFMVPHITYHGNLKSENNWGAKSQN